MIEMLVMVILQLLSNLLFLMPFFVTGKDFFFLLLFQLPIFFNENILKVLVGKNHIGIIYSERSLRRKKTKMVSIKIFTRVFFFKLCHG